jgi:hypothetical protein
VTDTTFRRIDQNSTRRRGTPRVLACGHSAEAAGKIAALLLALGVEDAAVRLATPDMIGMTLAEALAADTDEPPVPADQLPPVLVLAGFSGSEVTRFLDGFSVTGLPRPIFAGVTPTNLGMTVRQLLRDLLAEHRAMAEARDR